MVWDRPHPDPDSSGGKKVSETDPQYLSTKFISLSLTHTHTHTLSFSLSADLGTPVFLITAENMAGWEGPLAARNKQTTFSVNQGR